MTQFQWTSLLGFISALFRRKDVLDEHTKRFFMAQIIVPVFFPKLIFHGLSLPRQLLGSCVVSPSPQDLQLKLPVRQGPSFPQLNPMIKNQLVPGREIPFLTLQWKHLENHHWSALLFLMYNIDRAFSSDFPLILFQTILGTVVLTRGKQSTAALH